MSASGLSQQPASWRDQLQPASWRGVPFAVKTSEYPRGRRQAPHEYPKRDVPWVEDMGRASRVIAFSGFVVGDDCFQQAKALLDAAEREGPGSLVHPSLGSMTVSLLAPLVPIERAELGRVVELRFEFMETGSPIFPGDAASTQDNVADKAAATDTASTSDFEDAVGGGTQAKPAAAGQGASLPATSYTDAAGKTSTIPASPSGVAYQANIGSEVASSWGAGASQQAADPNLAAGSTANVEAPPGTTFGRFDPPATPANANPSGTAGRTAQDALDEQVQQRKQVDDTAERAARAALIS